MPPPLYSASVWSESTIGECLIFSSYSVPESAVMTVSDAWSTTELTLPFLTSVPW